MFNVALGITAQCCLTLLPMYLVLWIELLMIIIIILAVIVFILKEHGGINWKINKPDKITI